MLVEEWIVVKNIDTVNLRKTVLNNMIPVVAPHQLVTLLIVDWPGLMQEG